MNFGLSVELCRESEGIRPLTCKKIMMEAREDDKLPWAPARSSPCSSEACASQPDNEQKRRQTALFFPLSLR